MNYDTWKADAPDPGTVADRCDLCRCELYPEEAVDGRCRRCTQDALDADGEDFRGGEAAAYATEQHEFERGLK